MLGRFEKLLDSAGKLTVMDALVAAGLVYTVMLIGKQGVKAYQAWSSSSTLTAADIDLLTKELATVLGKYHKAQYEISHQALGSALEEINQALADCERAVRRKPVLVSDNVCDNKDTYAKSLEKRAEIYYWQGHYKAAEEDLLKAFRLGHAKVTTLNLLAHLYMNHLGEPIKAERYLARSKQLSDQQLFVKFYDSIFTNNTSDADQAANQVLAIYHQHAMLAVQAEQPPSVTAWATLNHTFPVICVPHMLRNWLETKMVRQKDPRVLLQTADSLKTLFTEHAHAIPEKLKTMLQVGRIKALFQLAKQRELDQWFTQDELVLRQHVAKQLYNDQRMTSYFDYSGEHIDGTVSRLFPKGLQTDYLASEHYRNLLGPVIRRWAELEGFGAEENSPAHDLYVNLQALAHTPQDVRLSSAVDDICKRDDIVNFFIATHVKGAGWKPWLRAFEVVAQNEAGQVTKTISLLTIACLEQHVNLRVNEFVRQGEVDVMYANPHSGIDVDGDVAHLSVVYDSKSGQYSLLRELSLPSELYHSLALRECWELLEKDDPNNQAVLEILGAQAYARLTIMAVERFSEEKLSRQAKDAVAAGLEKYIYAYQASAEEKELAQNILTNYRRCAPQSTSSKGIFSFTNIAIGVSLGLAASAAAVTLLRK